MSFLLVYLTKYNKVHKYVEDARLLFISYRNFTLTYVPTCFYLIRNKFVYIFNKTLKRDSLTCATLSLLTSNKIKNIPST